MNRTTSNLRAALVTAIAIAICVWLLALSMAAFGNEKPTPTPPQPTTVTAAAGAAADAAAKATAEADAAAQAAANATGGGGGQGVGEVGVSFESDYLGLTMPGQTAAPAVGGHQCLEHIRGGSGLSIGITGRTRFNEQCMCIELAREFAKLGFPEDAKAQLRSCAGVAAVVKSPPEPPPPTVAELPNCSVQTERVLQECATK